MVFITSGAPHRCFRSQLPFSFRRLERQLRLTSNLPDFLRDSFTTLFAFEAFSWRSYPEWLTMSTTAELFQERGREGNSKSCAERRGSRRCWCKGRKQIRAGGRGQTCGAVIPNRWGDMSPLAKTRFAVRKMGKLFCCSESWRKELSNVTSTNVDLMELKKKKKAHHKSYCPVILQSVILHFSFSPQLILLMYRSNITPSRKLFFFSFACEIWVQMLCTESSALIIKWNALKTNQSKVSQQTQTGVYWETPSEY